MAGVPPLVIRERDFDYQKRRIALFEDLLKGYPATAPEIQAAARQDIPPLLRGRVWAALLGVEGDTEGQYEAIDKFAEGAFDRQVCFFSFLIDVCC